MRYINTLSRILYKPVCLHHHSYFLKLNSPFKGSLHFERSFTEQKNFEKPLDAAPPPNVPKKKRIRWGRWILGGLAGYVVYLIFPKPREFTDPLHYYSNWMIRAYTSLPFNFISPIVGHLSTHEIPVSWRKTVLGGIASLTGMRMDEASEESFEAYPSFAALFNRELKEFVRPISACQLVSPADGRVLHFGEIVEGRIESVKERDYDIKDFIGPAKIETKPKNKLYQIVIYLAPADYHAFHSPASWDVNEKIHHPGFLLSVNPYFFNLIPTLLAINERVALCGKWKHGFFSYTAVAATNVGDIVIGTKSHKSREKLRYRTVDHEVFDEHYSYKKGEKVGEFRAGSTIVLIFEAPPELRFAIKAGDKLKYGQSLIVKDV